MLFMICAFKNKIIITNIEYMTLQKYISEMYKKNEKTRRQLNCALRFSFYILILLIVQKTRHVYKDRSFIEMQGHILLPCIEDCYMNWCFFIANISVE